MKILFEQIRQSYVVEIHFIKFAELQPSLFSVTITVKLYIVYHGKQTREVTFLGKSFSRYLKKLENIIFLLYLSVFYIHTSLHCRQTVRRVAVLTCKQEQHSNCEWGCQTFSYCNVIWALISWFLSSSNF